ncbi:serine hydrolase-like protein [Plodia interpunctella]|uniref:serine hydrolase-like protein n=1 Tax=Plodia interpunctella TaxID=58824 RepID=UPI0023675BB8|nr:serine hydrolase-like protein [Plodia interpunctella]
MRLTGVLRNVVSNTLTHRLEKEIVIKAPWGNIAALTWGDPAKPPVCLVQGKLDACSSFRPLVSLLPDDYFYVSIDLPGNGLSDHLPKGIRYTAVDLVPSIVEVKNHFKWDKFAFVGHSLGVLVGKYFILAYPGQITKAVELDPMPAYFSWEVNQISVWYKLNYERYYGEQYLKWNSGKETAPKYTFEEIQERMMRARGLSKEATAHILERSLEPAGDGLYRITYDQRMKFVTTPQLSASNLQQLYTSIRSPTFVILARNTIDGGFYDKAPFLQDPKSWPHNNYKYMIVDGSHDIHVENPECVVNEISQFLKFGLANS